MASTRTRVSFAQKKKSAPSDPFAVHRVAGQVYVQRSRRVQGETCQAARETAMPRPRSRSHSPGRERRPPSVAGVVPTTPTIDARTPIPPPVTGPGGIPLEIQVQIDRSAYYLGTAMLLFVVLLWILVSPMSQSHDGVAPRAG